MTQFINEAEEKDSELARLRAERDGYKEALDRVKNINRKTLLGLSAAIDKQNHEIIELYDKLTDANEQTASRCMELCKAKGQAYYYESSEAKSEGAYDCAAAIKAEFGLEGK